MVEVTESKGVGPCQTVGLRSSDIIFFVQFL